MSQVQHLPSNLSLADLICQHLIDRFGGQHMQAYKLGEFEIAFWYSCGRWCLLGINGTAVVVHDSYDQLVGAVDLVTPSGLDELERLIGVLCGKP